MHKRLRKEIESRIRELKDMRDHTKPSINSAKFGSLVGQITSLEWVLREDDIRAHNRAFDLAKKKAGITDVASLTPQQFSDLCADAESIRRTAVKTQEGECQSQSTESHCSGTSEKIPS